MTATIQSRTDVAAVGTIAFTSPSLQWGDTFLIAGTTPGDAYYYLLIFDTTNNIYVWSRGGLGSILSNQPLQQGFQLHYFRYGPNFNLPWPRNETNLLFIPYLDPEGTQPLETTNTVMTVNVTTANAASLALETFSSSSLGVQINSADPIGIFNTGNLQAGYHYVFQSDTGIRPNIPTYLDIGPLPTDSPFAGIPYGVGALSNAGVNILAVPFVLNWWISNDTATCGGQVTPAPNTDNLKYHMCDRYGVMVGTTGAFYTNNCTNINAFRGNVQLTDCAATGGYMYYLPARNPAQGCGKPWVFQDTVFVDMTETRINGVANPYGGCYDQDEFSICTYDSVGTAACQVAARTSDTCRQVRATPCPNCANCTTNCANGESCSPSDYCSNCTPVCSADVCPPPTEIPAWVWVIMIVLGAIALLLIFTLLHKSSKDDLDKSGKKYSEKDHAEPAKEVDKNSSKK